MEFHEEIDAIDRIRKGNRARQRRADSNWFLKRYKQSNVLRQQKARKLFKEDASYNAQRHINLSKYFKNRKEPNRSLLSPGMIKIKGEKALQARQQALLKEQKARQQALFLSNFTDYRGIRNVILTVPTLLFLSIFLFIIGITDLPADEVGYMFPSNYNQTYIDYADESGMDLIDLSDKSSVQGYSAVVPNLVTNGDFSNGTTGWSPRFSTSTLVETDGILRWTITDARNYVTVFGQSCNTTSNNIYLFKIRLNPSKPTTFFITNRPDTGYFGTNNLTFSITTGWQTKTIVGSFALSSTQINFGLGLTTPYENNDYIDFDYIQMINLTEMVNKGLIAEPTQASYETWLVQNTIYDTTDYFTNAWDLRYKFGRNMQYYNTWNINTGEIIDIDSRNFDLYKLKWFGWQKQNISLLDLQDEQERICDNQCYLEARQEIIDNPELGYLPEYLGQRTLFGISATYKALNGALRAINFARLKWIFPLWVDSFDEFIDNFKNFNPDQPIYGGS